LKEKVLPSNNSLSTSHQKVKKPFIVVGLPSKFIHAYKNDASYLGMNIKTWMHAWYVTHFDTTMT
jgi:predicted DNA binding CopG/RHH family protein